MAYEKHSWETGEVITAEKLNHVEEGIKELSDYDLEVEISASVTNDSTDYDITAIKGISFEEIIEKTKALLPVSGCYIVKSNISNNLAIGKVIPSIESFYHYVSDNEIYQGIDMFGWLSSDQRITIEMTENAIAFDRGGIQKNYSYTYSNGVYTILEPGSDAD